MFNHHSLIPSLGIISGSTRREMGIISGSIWGSFQGWGSFRGRDHFGGCTDQKSANVVRRQLSDLGKKINRDLHPEHRTINLTQSK